MAGPADSEEATPAQDRSATPQTQEVVLTEGEVSVVVVVVLTEAVVAASVEEADLMREAAVVVVPAQAGVVALPEADLTNKPLHTRADREASPRTCKCIINHAVPLDPNRLAATPRRATGPDW